MRGFAGIVVLLASLALASQAFAHASLVKAEPADGAMVAEPPAMLKLTFNEPISPLILRLVGPSGEVTTPPAAAEGPVVTVTPPRLRQGTHVLSWRVISADGHPVGGSIVFSVGSASAQAGPLVRDLGDPNVRAITWVAKVIVYLGLFVGVGGAFFQAWFADPGQRVIVPLLVLLLLGGLLATVASVGLQGLDALDLGLAGLMQKVAWRIGLETSYGLTAIVAAAALCGGILALAAKSALGARGFSAAALVGVGLALALSGHASVAPPRWLTQPSVFLHGVCCAFWIGALLPLVAELRRPGRSTCALMQFSKLIPYPIVILVVTGTALAVVQLQRPSALWATSYGLVFAGKLAAIAVLLTLGALNRFVLVPRLDTGASARSFRRSVGAEVVVATVILALVATWRFTPPPRSLAAADAPVSVHVHNERAMAQIEIDPRPSHGAHLGVRVNVLVFDGELRPLAAKEVTLVLSNPSAGIEPVRRAAVRRGDINWQIDGLPIPVGGHWRVRVEILISDFEKVGLEEEVMLPRSP